MKKSPIKRMRSLWVALLVALVAGATGAAGATAVAAPAPSAHASGLTAKQKRAKKRELKRCNKIRNAKKRKACVKRVNRKYAKPAPKGKTYTVDVMDDYFMPNALSLKANDWVDWTWKNSTVREGHNVNLAPPMPRGVIAGDFQSPGVVTGPAGRFKRQFTKPGTYNLYCNLHAGMTMTVNVSG